MASTGERLNYTECYTQEIINEARISFAYSRFVTTCYVGGQYNIFFFRRIYIKMEFSSQREIPGDSDNLDFGIH